MARGENPEGLLTIETVATGNTALTYDATKPFGHDNAGKDLVLSLDSNGKAILGADGTMVLGKFMSLDKDGVASYMPAGKPILLRKSAAAITFGLGVLCAGSGKVKSPISEADRDRARGIVVEVLETADNGRILVYMP